MTINTTARKMLSILTEIRDLRLDGEPAELERLNTGLAKLTALASVLRITQPTRIKRKARNR